MTNVLTNKANKGKLQLVKIPPIIYSQEFNYMENENPQKVRTVTTRQKQKNGDIYIIERQTVYDPVRKFNRVIKTRLIGKIQKDSGNVVETSPQKNNNEIQVKEHICMTDILDFIGKTSGIDKGIYDSTDPGTAQKIISIARYIFCSNSNNLTGLEIFQLNHHLPYKYPITDDVCCGLFAKIGRDETLMQNFFMSRAEMLENTDSIAFDSSIITPCFNDLSPLFDNADTLKFLTLYDTTLKMPIAFTKLPSYLSEIAARLNGISQVRLLGINPVEIITDDVCCTEKDIETLLLSECHFITMVDTGLKWVYSEIDSHIKEFDLGKNVCETESETQCVTVMLMKECHIERKYTGKAKNESKEESGTLTRRSYLHLYYSKTQAAEEENAFRNDLNDIKILIESGVKIEKLSKTAQSKVSKYLILKKPKKVSFNEEACAERNKYNGFFALVADNEKDGKQCLIKYRIREYIEENYRNMKQYTDMNRARCWSADILTGGMFVQFIALCYYEYMAYLVRNLKNESKKVIENNENAYTESEIKKEQNLLAWLRERSIYNQLQWFDIIENERVSPQIQKMRWSAESLETDRLYLKRLGLPEKYSAKV